MVYEKLLIPTNDAYIVRQPLFQWISSLISILNSYKNVVDIKKSPDKFAACMNNSALVLSLVGEIDAAYQLCHEKISFYHAISKTAPTLLNLAIQPWINLGRLDRLSKLPDEAMSKFIFLKKPANECVKKCHLLQSPNIIKEALSNLPEDTNIRNVVDFCSIVEPIVTLLDSKNYETLLSAFSIVRVPKTQYEYILAEAQYIALIQSHCYQNGLNFIKNIFSTKHLSCRYIFLFRRAELACLLKDSVLLACLKNQLLEIIGKIDFQVKPNYHLLCYTQVIASFFLFNMKLEDIAEYLYQNCYSAFKILNDELGQLSVLKILAKHYGSVNNKYEEELYHLYRNTGYRFMIPVMLQDNYTYPPKILALVQQLKALVFSKVTLSDL